MMRYCSGPFRGDDDDLSPNIRSDFFPHPERLGRRVKDFDMWAKKKLSLSSQEAGGGIKVSCVSENENINSKMMG